MSDKWQISTIGSQLLQLKLPNKCNFKHFSNHIEDVSFCTNTSQTNFYSNIYSLGREKFYVD